MYNIVNVESTYMIIFYFSCRLAIPNVFNQIYAHLNCNNRDTGVLSAVNECAKQNNDLENIYNDDPSHLKHNNDLAVNDDSKHNDDASPDTSVAKIISQQLSTVEMPSIVPGVANNQDFVHPFARINTQNCSIDNSPHTEPCVAHTFPRTAAATISKDLGNQSFGIHPYAIIDVQKVRKIS